jgi:hypothetical protein
LRDNAKADLAAASLGEAVKRCIEAGMADQSHPASKQEKSPIALREILVVNNTAHIDVLSSVQISSSVVTATSPLSREAELSSRQGSSLFEVITTKETSHGIDPHCRCFSVVVWRRRILGSP